MEDCQEDKQTGHKEVFLFRKSCTEMEQIVPGGCRAEDYKWFRASNGQKEKNGDGLLHRLVVRQVLMVTSSSG